MMENCIVVTSDVANIQVQKFAFLGSGFLKQMTMAGNGYEWV